MPQLAPLLPPGQEQAACELARGTPVSMIAERLGVNRKTLFRWREQTDFKRRVEDLRCEINARFVGKLFDVGSEAIETLRRLCEHESPQIRLQAARALLSAVVGRIAPEKVAAEPPKQVCKVIVGIDPDAI